MKKIILGIVVIILGFAISGLISYYGPSWAVLSEPFSLWLTMVGFLSFVGGLIGGAILITGAHL